MPVLRWTLAVGLLFAAVAFAAPRLWQEKTEPIGTGSELAIPSIRAIRLVPVNGGVPVDAS